MRRIMSEKVYFSGRFWKTDNYYVAFLKKKKPVLNTLLVLGTGFIYVLIIPDYRRAHR